MKSVADLLSLFQHVELSFIFLSPDFTPDLFLHLGLLLCIQRSLEDEINRTTAEDIPIFMISYAVIFLYIAVALGEYSSWKRILVRCLLNFTLPIPFSFFQLIRTTL